MMGSLCISSPWPETPTTGWCCEGSAYRGAEGCLCWTPVYDLEQAEPQTGVDAQIRPKMCDDCAYRPGSPERTGDPAALADQAALDALVASGTPFWCHQGMRRPLKWIHPSGAEHPGSPLNYRPPIVDGVPFRSDGTPGDFCAGWAARWLNRKPAVG